MAAIAHRRPWAVHLSLVTLIAATLVGLSGGADRVAPAEAVRLDVASLTRASDGQLQLQAEPAGGRRGVPLMAGVDRIERPGQPSRIELPDIGIDSPVTQAGLVLRRNVATWEVVPNAVAYYEGSAVPGEAGNVVMAGHLNTPLSRQGAVFRKLPEARIGQPVYVWSGETRYTYTVTSVRVVKPERTDVMAPTSEPMLTLITCYPDVKFNQRLVVTASLTPGA